MSNDTPPRACLADFGFMTMVLDPKQPLSCSAQLEGGTTKFMAPELLVPSKYGSTDSAPTQKSDVYAFGLVIYHVRNQDRGYLSCAYTIQVLTGGIPFQDLRSGEIAARVVEGKRPPKPKNASGLGFCDSLWEFVERCWDGKPELRPRVTEVASRIGVAAAAWNGVMAPHAPIESIMSETPEPTSDSVAPCCKLHIPTIPCFSPLNNGTGTTSGLFSSAIPGSPTESRTISRLFGPPSTQSTQCTEPPSEPGIPHALPLLHIPRILNNLSEKQFRNWASSLQHEDMARMIDELDKVHPRSLFLASTLLKSA